MTAPRPPRPSGAGLTLIELLVSTTLVVVLITTTTTAFLQIRNLARRVQIRQELHNSARIIFERMRWETSCLMQGSAFFAIGTQGTSVELVFLRGKLDNLDFMTGSSYGFYANALTDQLWTRWYWDRSLGVLSLSASSPSRSVLVDKAWTNAGHGYQNSSLDQLPTPQRVIKPGATPAARLASTLNANELGAGAPVRCTQDYGDYQDLLNNAVPIAVNCTDFALEVVAQDGSTNAVSASAGADTAWLCDGQPVDGRAGVAAPAAAAALPGRPRLLRMRFTLTEPKTLLAETFSFSFLTPALAPGP